MSRIPGLGDKVWRLSDGRGGEIVKLSPEYPTVYTVKISKSVWQMKSLAEETIVVTRDELGQQFTLDPVKGLTLTSPRAQWGKRQAVKAPTDIEPQVTQSTEGSASSIDGDDGAKTEPLT